MTAHAAGEYIRHRGARRRCSFCQITALCTLLGYTVHRNFIIRMLYLNAYWQSFLTTLLMLSLVACSLYVRMRFVILTIKYYYYYRCKWVLLLLAPGRCAKYCDEYKCMLICLSVYVHLSACLLCLDNSKTYTAKLQFFCTLPVAVARSRFSSDGVAIRYVLPVLLMT